MSTMKIKQRIAGKGCGAILPPQIFRYRFLRQRGPSFVMTGGSRRHQAPDTGTLRLPKESTRFEYLSPSAEDIDRAVARKDNQVLQPSLAMAVNQLGRATQVPSKPTNMTKVPTRTKTDGRQIIQFRNASAKTIVGAGQRTGAVFQALRYVGKDRADDHVIGPLARALNADDRV